MTSEVRSGEDRTRELRTGELRTGEGTSLPLSSLQPI